MRPEARSAKRSLPSRAREEESADGCRHTTRRFARETACDGARENAKAGGFEIVYDKSYPPGTTDMVPIVRAIQAANPDLVFACAYPPDTVGIVRAANEMGLNTKMFATPIKVQLGPLMNGLVIMESFIPAPTLDFPGLKAMLEKYQAKAPSLGIDPLGYGFTPFAYAAGQVLAQAVEATKSLDHDKLADYVHAHKFSTVAGEIAFGKDGDEVTAVLHPISGCERERSRAVPRYRAPGDPMAAAI